MQKAGANSTTAFAGGIFGLTIVHIRNAPSTATDNAIASVASRTASMPCRNEGRRAACDMAIRVVAGAAIFYGCGSRPAWRPERWWLGICAYCLVRRLSQREKHSSREAEA